MTPNHRNLSIDFFRGIAIILITGYHVLPFINNPSKSIYIWDFYAPFLKGDIGVALFVFISGYVTQAFSSHLSWVNFIKKRFWRIAAPYYTALFIWNVLMSTNILTGGSHDLWDNLSHVFFVHNLHPRTIHSISGVFWYLGLQIQLYIVYLFLKEFILKYPLMIGICSFSLCLICNITPYILIPQSDWLPVITHSVLSYTFLFLLGVFSHIYLEKITPLLQKWYTFYGLILLSGWWLFLKGYLLGDMEIEKMILGLILGLIMLGMPVINIQNKLLRPFITIGTASYSIYLYNYIFWVFSPRFFAIKGLLIYSFVTIACGLAAYYFIEEPFLNKKASAKN